MADFAGYAEKYRKGGNRFETGSKIFLVGRLFGHLVFSPENILNSATPYFAAITVSMTASSAARRA
jgi:hypothetical protein